MLQTSMKLVPAQYSDISGQRATKGRNKRKTTARRASFESEEDGSRSHGEDGAIKGSADTLISFEKVLARGSIHTAECCRLGLPRAFCERYDLGGAVTATDSAGTRLWHMRFQSSARVRHPVFTISNGWREFSYDHGLKVRDRVVFTLLSASHFRVEFAASTRRMLATRDGAEYPWRINYARLDCLSRVIRINDGVPVASEILAPISLQEDEQGVEETRSSVAPITLHEDEQGVIRIRVQDEEVMADEEHVQRSIHIRVADEDERLKREAAAEEEGVQGLLRKNVMADYQKEMFCQCDMAMARKGAVKSEYIEAAAEEEAVQGLLRKTAMADYQKMEMFCQCDMAIARKGAVKSEYVVPELTHLECKNADGSSYLQIIDSDSDY